MIHYHGGPITPERAAFQIWKGRHAFISFAYPQQLAIASTCSQSFALDNGAFSFWKSQKKVKWKEYYRWCETILDYPNCDWAVIPDVINGTEKENDDLIKEWPFGFRGVPVWHLNESIERLIELSQEWPRVALGSSGEYDVANPSACLGRLREAIKSICNKERVPTVKLHGLRMLNTSIFTVIPLASADSTTVARNIGLDVQWRNGIAPISKGIRGMVMIDKIEYFNSPVSLPKVREKIKGFGI